MFLNIPNRLASSSCVWEKKYISEVVWIILAPILVINKTTAQRTTFGVEIKEIKTVERMVTPKPI